MSEGLDACGPGCVRAWSRICAGNRCEVSVRAP